MPWVGAQPDVFKSILEQFLADRRQLAASADELNPRRARDLLISEIGCIFPMMKSSTIGHFEMLRDALRAFSSMAETMIYTSKKHNTSFNALGANLSDSAAMKALASEIEPSRMGFLVAGLTGMTRIQGGLREFMNYEPDQMLEFKEELDSVVAKFDQALEDGRDV